MPEELVAHTGTPDVEDLPEGIMRHPDVMEIQGAFDPRTGSGAVMTDIHATPEGPHRGLDIPTDNLPRYA
ncbi:hypothetical protein ACOBQB_23845 [Streptomyces sp. G5(2025)]|uniref:hypothetical protein n=1 Tax=Streptomyces sp. G5(2025) TaxID=3406628 RepID=UPI003C26F0BA